MTPTDTLSREFPAVPAAVRNARSFAVEASASAGVDVEALEVVVSELASNAVLHAQTSFVVTVEHLDDGVRVGVADGSPTVPRSRTADPMAVTGRGLRIVQALVRRWRVDARPDGKTIWFELGSLAP